MGIEPTSTAWKAEVLPLNYTRRPHADNKKLQAPAAEAQHRCGFKRRHRLLRLEFSKHGGGGRIRTSEGGAVRFTV